ncbi:MAG: bifunctional methylenetetrahydrofolate dehydrogenase/methenyltetrahydrofolate cyclohydrolase FolD [Spirochaetales bacterium]|nr:bifunctional methylenetetrahydrofolate dehydrogenase/methenyltetrahydrofolate cyclohydrolase FolD [Spirochaetales bacterium]
MTAAVLSGKTLAQELRQSLKETVSSLAQNGVVPGLAVVLLGDDPASSSYVLGKERTCRELGMRSFDHHLSAATSQAELLSLISQLNANPDVHGILVQLPLPQHINAQEILQNINPDKDVDGFHPVSVGKMVLGEETFLPCTPFGILKLLEKAHVTLSGAEVVIVGRSNIVGKPLALLLMQQPYNATVTVCHTKTKDLAVHLRRADIIIAAAGRPHTVTAEMVKPGACVIDVGVNRIEDLTNPKGFRLIGDVDYDEVALLASAITPVPGGVGPMTITMLMYNTVLSACRRHGIAFPL